MMKLLSRLLAVLLVIALLIPCALAKEEKPEKNYKYSNMFTLKYPDGWEIVTDESGNTEDDKFAGLLYSPEDDGLNLEIYLSHYPDWDDVNLMTLSANEVKSYSQMIVDTSPNAKSKLKEIVYTKRDGVPFAVTTENDDQGPLFYADTMLNGWNVMLYGYAYADDTYTTVRALTNADYTLFRSILETFTPGTLLQ